MTEILQLDINTDLPPPNYRRATKHSCGKCVLLTNIYDQLREITKIVGKLDRKVKYNAIINLQFLILTIQLVLLILFIRLYLYFV